MPQFPQGMLPRSPQHPPTPPPTLAQASPSLPGCAVLGGPGSNLRGSQRGVWGSRYMPPTTTTQDLCPPCLSPQYYDGTFPTAKEQAAFERNIFSKTHQMGGELGGGGGVPHGSFCNHRGHAVAKGLMLKGGA